MNTEANRKIVFQYAMIVSMIGTVLFFLAALPMGIIAAVMGSTYFLLGPVAAMMPEYSGDRWIVWLALLYVPMMVACAVRFNPLTVVVCFAGFVLWHFTGIYAFVYLLMKNVG